MATSTATNTESGIVCLQGNHAVDETVAKLQGILQVRGVKLFTVVDHSCSSSGIPRPERRSCSPRPVRPSISTILVAEDAAGKT